ncbi:MAG: dihydrolipoyl dehydrogenase [Halobacteriovoraceae bacterium]|nr:dihydrolipoyl dehydrogenase [Halobacteriovoraceae bacterium]
MLKKIFIFCLFLILIITIKLFGLDQYLSFEYIKENQSLFESYYLTHRFTTIFAFFGIYIISTALSIPGATVLTLLGGALFGLELGLVLISFASSIGATMAFLISRTVLRDYVEKKYARYLKRINEGVKKEGGFYLFSLRLVPLFPFFLINLTMGLTKLSAFKFYVISQIGMLPGTFVYVNAGSQLSDLESLEGIMGPDIIGSFVLLGLFPLLAKKILEWLKAKKVYRNYKKPKNFDYNIVTIGAGSGGLVASYIAAAVKAKVALIEKDKMGGDCLNTGCVPSKALLKSAKMAHALKVAKDYGVHAQGIKIDFQQVMKRVQQVIKKIEPHDSIERYESLGVECIQGEAKIISPWEIEVNSKIVTTKNIIIATGASPFIPPIKGIESIKYLTSHNLWQLKSLPQKLVILGGGPIGLEMALAFHRLGSKVTVVEMGTRLMMKEDNDISEMVLENLKEEGIEVLLEHEATEVHNGKLICSHQSENIEVLFDEILIAVGRKANTKGFGLEELKIELNSNGTIKTNDFLQTKFPNIYACGDVAGPYQLTHTASHQAWYCTVNALFSPFKKFKVDYRVIPWCTYLDPEVATVGLNETACLESGIEYAVYTYDISDLDRAIADGVDKGIVKVLLAKNSDKILGATIVAANAGELIAEFVTSMKHSKGLNHILGTIHSYPTMAEANKFVAGQWKRKTAPQRLLAMAQKFHSWRR